MRQLKKGVLCAMLCAAMVVLAGCQRKDETDRVTERETVAATDQGETLETDNIVNGATSGENQNDNDGVLENAGEDLKNGVENAGEDLMDGAEKIGDDIKNGAEDMGEDIRDGAERTEDQMSENAEERQTENR